MAKATVLLILNSFLLLVAMSLVPAAANEAFVRKMCNNTADPNLCSTILLSDPRSVNATSVEGLAFIALDLATRTADAAFSHASDLSDQYAGMPEQEPLDMCKQAFLEAGDDLREAQMDASQQNYPSARDKATEAEDEADSCEKAFADQGLKSLMSDIDKVSHDQSDLAGDIFDLLSGTFKNRS